MRHRKAGRGNPLFAVEQKIEVECPWTAHRPFPSTPERGLDREQQVEEFPSGERRLEGGSAVQKARLVHDRPDWVCLAKRRDGEDLDRGIRGQRLDCGA